MAGDRTVNRSGETGMLGALLDMPTIWGTAWLDAAQWNLSTTPGVYGTGSVAVEIQVYAKPVSGPPEAEIRVGDRMARGWRGPLAS